MEESQLIDLLDESRDILESPHFRTQLRETISQSLTYFVEDELERFVENDGKETLTETVIPVSKLAPWYAASSDPVFLGGELDVNSSCYEVNRYVRVFADQSGAILDEFGKIVTGLY